jgi:hypothetical protein
MATVSRVVVDIRKETARKSKESQAISEKHEPWDIIRKTSRSLATSNNFGTRQTIQCIELPDDRKRDKGGRIIVSGMRMRAVTRLRLN